MKKIVSFCHNSEKIFGSGEKRIQPSEYEVINSQRKSIYAKNNIKKGKFLVKKFMRQRSRREHIAKIFGYSNWQKIKS